MDGYKNEYNFVLEFNNKKVCELNPISQDLIYAIFDNVKSYNTIKSWTNHFNQKTDIFIKIGHIIKGISIKMGNRNSVHVESIENFIQFLKNHNIPNDIIKEYLRFHYADGTIDNTGSNRLSAEEYKYKYQDSLDKINNYFNDKNIIEDAIDRFVLIGNNSEYSIDAMICGTPNDFLWITKKDIKNYLLDNINYCSSPHFSELVCQPMARCINHNKKYERFREYVQIKWYSMFNNIIDQMNQKVMMKK